MSFPRYAEYKDSEVEWLGEVPRHWKVLRIKHLLKSLEQGWSPQCDATPVESPDEWGVLKVGCVNGGVFNPGENKALPPELDPIPSLGIKASDLLISRANTRELVGSAAVALVDHPNLMLCDKLFRLRFSPAICSPHFIAAYLSIGKVRGQIELAASGASSSMLNIGQSTILEMEIALPDSAEQAEICGFLQLETAKINGLMVEQEKLIALLKEKRQAVIFNAVTKGLSPRVMLKDSEVGWLGKVPAHWRVMPIRLAARLESGHTPSRSKPEYWEDCYLPWFTLADVWQIRQGGQDYVSETKELVSDLGLANSSARMLPKGTVILSRTASVGFSAIMAVDMATTQDFANWVCGEELLPEYLLYTFRSMDAEFKRLMMGSTHNTIYMPDIQSFRFTLPPMVEQKAIGEHIRTKLSELDELISTAEKAIELLKERRIALISAAVTGQIDVRGLVKEEQEHAA